MFPTWECGHRYYVDDRAQVIQRAMVLFLDKRLLFIKPFIANRLISPIGKLNDLTQKNLRKSISPVIPHISLPSSLTSTLTSIPISILT